ELFRPLWTFRAYILVFAASSMLGALALTYIYSEKYEVKKTIIFKPFEVTRIQGNETQTFGTPAPPAPYKLVGATFDQLVQSELILADVVKKLSLDVPEPRIYSGICNEWMSDIGPCIIQLYKMAKDWVSDVGSDIWSILKYGRIVGDPTAGAIASLRQNIR